MTSIIRAALGALLLSALAAGSPVTKPQFASGTPCEEMPVGKYVCTDNWNWIVSLSLQNTCLIATSFPRKQSSHSSLRTSAAPNMSSSTSLSAMVAPANMLATEFPTAGVRRLLDSHKSSLPKKMVARFGITFTGAGFAT
ncbi:uncharacterized protein PAC_06014 [Phialocephala subalpina]|uniref:Uncharacterized protein n=1 Tax=Phialocephala subalpina TaxID=576137 RepID=A0A1L7WTN8_9HELO|nr:uncharacterized protein PAC_06014 [Phialocephala subalpina]